MQPQHCINCSTAVSGNFCQECGQSVSTHDINWHFLWHDIQHGLFHFEKGFLYTIKQLFTRPGHTIREFIEGKRVKHYKPIAFLIVIAGIYSFLNHYFHLSEMLLKSMPRQQTQVMDNKVIQFVN